MSGLFALANWPLALIRKSDAIRSSEPSGPSRTICHFDSASSQ